MSGPEGRREGRWGREGGWRVGEGGRGKNVSGGGREGKECEWSEGGREGKECE